MLIPVYLDSLPKKLTCWIHFNLLLLSEVVADYCEFGTCDEDEYCCGDNKCCKNSPGVLYLWGIGIFILMVLFLLCMWAKFRKNTGVENPYRLLPEGPDIEVPTLAT